MVHQGRKRTSRASRMERAMCKAMAVNVTAQANMAK
jgi:hypothetical protein